MFRFLDFVAQKFEGTFLGDIFVNKAGHLDSIMTKLIAKAMEDPEDTALERHDLELDGSSDLLASNDYDSVQIEVLPVADIGDPIIEFLSTSFEPPVEILNQDFENYVLKPVLQEEVFTDSEKAEKESVELSFDNDDVLTMTPELVASGGPLPETILNFDAISQIDESLTQLQPLNDAGNKVRLDATDILDFGNNLILTGDQLDSIEFDGEGWSKLEQSDANLYGIEFREGYDTFMHESGAIVQIDTLIQTNFHDYTTEQ